MTDRELDYRIAAEATLRSYQDPAKASVDACVLPGPDDTRRLLALTDALGDLSASLSRGHSDLSSELGLMGAIVLEWLTESIAFEARRPVVEGNGQWEP